MLVCQASVTCARKRKYGVFQSDFGRAKTFSMTQCYTESVQKQALLTTCTKLQRKSSWIALWKERMYWLFFHLVCHYGLVHADLSGSFQTYNRLCSFLSPHSMYMVIVHPCITTVMWIDRAYKYMLSCHSYYATFQQHKSLMLNRPDPLPFTRGCDYSRQHSNVIVFLHAADGSK